MLKGHNYKTERTQIVVRVVSCCIMVMVSPVHSNRKQRREKKNLPLELLSFSVTVRKSPAHTDKNPRKNNMALHVLSKCIMIAKSIINANRKPRKGKM